jgi:hypothetical protein
VVSVRRKLSDEIATLMSAAILWIVVLGVMGAAIFYLLLTPLRAIRKEQRELLSTGQAAVGTIVAMDAIAQGRGGTMYGVTVEFTPAGFGEPVRVQLQLSAREADKLAVYQQVPIHFRDQIPIVAAIDQCVR